MSAPTSLAEHRYTITERLGAGGMASVYRCYDQRLRTWRAAKLMDPKLARKKKIRARFEREAHAMARLEHKHVVRVYDVGMQDDVPYIIMELAEGGCIIDWLDAHGAMPVRLAVDVLIAASLGVQAAHEEGIIHRDIKPDNILVDRKGVCKVTDFGIARQLDDLSQTKTGSVMGTWAYMAPEQRTDAKNVDHRADIYALAATLVCLTTDELPHDLFAVAQDESRLAGVPEVLVPIVRKAVSYNPADRHSTAEEFAADLMSLRDVLPVDPSTPPLVTKRLETTTQPPEPTTERLNRESPSDTDEASSSPVREAPASPLPYFASTYGTETLDDGLPAYVDRAAMAHSLNKSDGFITTEEALKTGVTLGPEAPAPTEEELKKANADVAVASRSDGAADAASMVGEFAGQIGKAFVKMFLNPLMMLSIPLCLGLFIFAVSMYSGSDSIGTAELAANDAGAELLSAIETEQGIVDDLHAIGGNWERAREYLKPVQSAPNPKSAQVAALLYVDFIHKEVERRASQAPAVVQAQARSSLERSERMDDAMRKYRAAQQKWREAANTTSGGIAVSLGLAHAPK